MTDPKTISILAIFLQQNNFEKQNESYNLRCLNLKRIQKLDKTIKQTGQFIVLYLSAMPLDGNGELSDAIFASILGLVHTYYH